MKVEPWFGGGLNQLLAVLTQYPVLHLTQLDATVQKSGKPLTFSQTASNSNKWGIRKFMILLRSRKSSRHSNPTYRQVKGSALVALVEMKDSSAVQRFPVMEASTKAFQMMDSLSTHSATPLSKKGKVLDVPGEIWCLSDVRSNFSFFPSGQYFIWVSNAMKHIDVWIGQLCFAICVSQNKRIRLVIFYILYLIVN